MKNIFVAVVLVSIMAVIHCNDEPTDAQEQCFTEATTDRDTEILKACSDAIMEDDSVRFYRFCRLSVTVILASTLLQWTSFPES